MAEFTIGWCFGALMAFAGIAFYANAVWKDPRIENCKRENNVYECHLVGVPGPAK